MAKPTKKKVLSWISFGVSAIIFAFALSVFIISITARSRGGRAEIFGYSFAVVATNSMYPEIKAGDLIIVKTCGITSMAEGENAVFIGISGEYEGKYIVHKVVAIEEAEGGGIALRTKGVANDLEDEELVTAENFVGKEVHHSTVLGSIMVFLQQPLNWVYVLVFLLAIGFAVSRGVKIVKLVKEKKKKEKAGEKAQSASPADEDPPKDEEKNE